MKFTISYLLRHVGLSDTFSMDMGVVNIAEPLGNNNLGAPDGS